MPITTRLLLACLLVTAFVGLARTADAPAADQNMTITLPPSSDLVRLADLVAEFTKVSLQYSPQKLQGSVNLAVRRELTPDELWAIFNQVLVGQNFTTVLSGEPAVYHIVPMNE